MASKNSLTNKTLSGVMWKFGERISAQLVSTLVSIILARLLMPEDYGVVALVIVFINLCNVFVTSGFGTALVQKKDADDLDFTSVLYFGLFFAMLLYVLVFCCAPLIASFYENEILTPIIRVMGLRIVIASINTVQHAYLDRKMQFKKFFIATLFGTIVSGVVGVWMAYAGYGPWAIVAQYLTNVCIDTVVLAFVIKWFPRLRISFVRLRGLFSFGWKLLVSALIDTGYNELRSLIIGKKYNEESLAYYDKGKNFPCLISANINAAVNPVLLSSMAKLQDNREKVKEATRKSIRFCSFVVVPCMVGLACIGKTFIEVILTEKWMPMLPFLYIMCVTYMFFPIHTANLTAIQAMGRSDLFLKLEIAKKIVGIALIVISMWFGVIWIAVSALVGTIISSIINAFPNKKLLNYGWLEQIKDILPSLILSIFMGAPIFFMNYLAINKVLLLVLQIVTGIALYVLLNVITKNKTFFYVLDLIKGFLKKNKKEITIENKVAENDLLSFLRKCDNMFTIPLSKRTDLRLYSKKIATNSQIFVAKQGGKIVGLISYYSNDLENRVGYITILCVLPDYRGQGLSKKLMDKAIENCKSAGMNTIKLEVYKSNIVAYSLYSNYGFKAENDNEHMKMVLNLNEKD